MDRFSPDDKNKVKTALSMLAEKGTLDDLGVGQFRDAIEICRFLFS